MRLYSHLHILDWVKGMEGTFTDVGKASYRFPIGAWKETRSSSRFSPPNNGADIRLFAVYESDRVVAELMLRNAGTLPMSYRPVILSPGLYSPEEAEEIMERARDEVENVRVKQYAGVRWHCDIHGVSRADFFRIGYCVWAVRTTAAVERKVFAICQGRTNSLN